MIKSVEDIVLPNGCYEFVSNGNVVKASRETVENYNRDSKLSKGTMVYFLGNGYSYKGTIYHKNTKFIYIKLQ